jgi:hypothetical protein
MMEEESTTEAPSSPESHALLKIGWRQEGYRVVKSDDDADLKHAVDVADSSHVSAGSHDVEQAGAGARGGEGCDGCERARERERAEAAGHFARVLSWAALVTATLTFAAIGPTFKLMLSAGVPPVRAAAWRAQAQLLFILPIAAVEMRLTAPDKRWELFRRANAVATLLNGVAWGSELAAWVSGPRPSHVRESWRRLSRHLHLSVPLLPPPHRPAGHRAEVHDQRARLPLRLAPPLHAPPLHEHPRPGRVAW